MSDQKPQGFSHEKIETHSFLMVVLILLVIAVGGLVEIVPLFFQSSTTLIAGDDIEFSSQRFNLRRVRHVNNYPSQL
jgi:cbb3-type cytochrome oxidase cytochrome c subunit